MVKNLDVIAEKALGHFGYEHQIIKSIEELSELVTSLARYYNNNIGMSICVAEEIADCTIMLAQLRLLFDPSVVDGKIRQKLERLENMIVSDQGGA